jgi:hypothetical protein
MVENFSHLRDLELLENGNIGYFYPSFHGCVALHSILLQRGLVRWS